KDTGKGIKAEFIPKLFTRFTQEDGSTSRAYGGLGLGLSIVRHLVEMHGGTVNAESPGEGKGAVFTVDLPCAETDRLPDAGIENPKSKTTENPISVPPANLAELRILIVDDDKNAREGLQRYFQSLGAEVLIAESADSGYSALSEFKPDILLCDIAMPETDGYSLIQR